ncbi:unnamed protein product [Heligmosomoides polygyrus]|uniref:Uncharacterized protein n=1 Tax=Heligmosomoides polygyrus TaxID=6339 RepID=A0A183G305_HELPZ|nr:unnamed protein product [Heligmosomoides polygyrus]
MWSKASWPRLLALTTGSPKQREESIDSGGCNRCGKSKEPATTSGDSIDGMQSASGVTKELAPERRRRTDDSDDEYIRCYIITGYRSTSKKPNLFRGGRSGGKTMKNHVSLESAGDAVEETTPETKSGGDGPRARRSEVLE